MSWPWRQKRQVALQGCLQPKPRRYHHAPFTVLMCQQTGKYGRETKVVIKGAIMGGSKGQAGLASVLTLSVE